MATTTENKQPPKDQTQTQTYPSDWRMVENEEFDEHEELCQDSADMDDHLYNESEDDDQVSELRAKIRWQEEVMQRNEKTLEGCKSVIKYLEDKLGL